MTDHDLITTQSSSRSVGPIDAPRVQDPIYGGFWRRLAALLLDFLVLLPLGAIILWADALSRFGQVYCFLPGMIVGLIYHVYLVERYGGTPGKLMMGLAITKVDGLPVGRREAFLRYFPAFLFSLFMGIGMISGSFRMTETDQALPFAARSQRRMDLVPGVHLVQTLNNIWVWSEFLVLLTNKKRRALHDFLAGTVVIRRRPSTASA